MQPDITGSAAAVRALAGPLSEWPVASWIPLVPSRSLMRVAAMLRAMVIHSPSLTRWAPARWQASLALYQEILTQGLPVEVDSGRPVVAFIFASYFMMQKSFRINLLSFGANI